MSEDENAKKFIDAVSKESQKEVWKAFRDQIVFGEGRLRITAKGIKHVPYPFDDDKDTWQRENEATGL